MVRTTLAILLTSALSASAAPAVKDAPKDGKKDAIATHLEKLAGLWKLEKEIRDGVEKKEVEDIQLTFKGDKVILTEDGKAMEAKLKIDPTKSPAEMDISIKDDNRDDTIQAIYEIDGDTLKIAFTKDGGARPAKLESTTGSKVTFGTLKRVKK